MQVNIDRLALGCIFRIGDDLYKKVSPMISAKLNGGELLFDARLTDKKASAPIVEWLPNAKNNFKNIEMPC